MKGKIISNTCYAAIDIGSNAVRLLIKKVKNNGTADRELSKVLMLRIPLRLGFDVFSLGKVSDKKVVKLCRLMKAFRQLMKIYDVTDYRACATSAIRDACNSKEIIKKIQKDTDITIEVIDGQEEAHMIYNNHIECMINCTSNYVYVDVGGGSTEVNLLVNGELQKSLSYNIGTVRMLSGAVHEDIWSQMCEELKQLTEGLGKVNIIGSGGNINKLYQLSEKKDKRKLLFPITSLQTLYEKLLPLTPEQRMKSFNLKEDRADVIVPASKIFLTIAKVVHAEYIYVPVVGLADGIIDTLYERKEGE